MPSIEFRLRSDATRLHDEGPCILCHVLSEALTWGLGFTQSIELRWPAAMAGIAERLRTTRPRAVLGDVIWTSIDERLSLAHLVAERTGRPHGLELDLVQLAGCFDRVAEHAIARQCSVHAPPIGSGLSGARWSDVEELVQSQLVKRGVQVVIHCLGSRMPD